MPHEVRKVQQAFRFALDLTPRQVRVFMEHAGIARFAFNWGVEQIETALCLRSEDREAGRELTNVPSHFDLCKLWVAHKHAHRHDPAPDGGQRPTNTGWVFGLAHSTVQAALRDAMVAWRNYFASCKGTRKGRLVARPRYKSRRHTRPSFQLHGSVLRVVDAHHLKLPTIGVVKTHEATRKLLRLIRAGRARVVRVNITLSGDGRWYAALTAEVERTVRTGPSARQRAGGTVGADLGVDMLATLSTGQSIPHPDLSAARARLERARRAHARTRPGSRRRARAGSRLARAYAHLRNRRLDAVHKVTSGLIHRHAEIVVEGWDVSQSLTRRQAGMPPKVARAQRRALADAAIGVTRWQLVSKSAWYGCNVVVTGPDLPTGRTCSKCWQVSAKPARLEARFRCGFCGHDAPRRYNTALALKGLGASDASSGGESQNGRGGGVSPGELRRPGRPPLRRQASTRRRRGETGTPGP